MPARTINAAAHPAAANVNREMAGVTVIGRITRTAEFGFHSPWTAVELAYLEGKITPHTLRHTAATWLIPAGIEVWQAASYLGMSAEILDRVYGHHHPGHLQQAARATGYRPKLAVA